MRNTEPSHSGLILLPPSPVSNKITVDLRLGMVNKSAESKQWRFELYLDKAEENCVLATETVEVQAGDWHLLKKTIPVAGLEGMHRVIGYVTNMETGEVMTHDRPLEVLNCADRSTDRIDGAFAGFYHWSELEGRLWNEEIKKMTRRDWCDLMKAMHEVGMDLLLPQEAFRNQEYVDKHYMEQDGYFGRAFYPSKLFPGRMDMIACDDPLDACFTAASELDMNILLPVGMYAWFDFSAGSLEWHKKVAQEMWERYGHHKSVYGFYVSEEVCGDLGATDKNRDDIVRFFEEFTAFCRTLAPERPIMLASNCHFIHRADAWYPKLLANLDILCPFAFHRMPQTI